MCVDVVDVLDVVLKSEGLCEEYVGEVVKVIVDLLMLYVSVKLFEDFGLSVELFRGLYGEMKFEKLLKI